MWALPVCGGHILELENPSKTDRAIGIFQILECGDLIRSHTSCLQVSGILKEVLKKACSCFFLSGLAYANS